MWSNILQSRVCCSKANGSGNRQMRRSMRDLTARVKVLGKISGTQHIYKSYEYPYSYPSKTELTPGSRAAHYDPLRNDKVKS
ncbi:hypothetical protein KQX54_021421 [Cotesia glomerata]|uniref:Uncharacterized protein n=1 Tax=Cotesia glomerata TaxID=32391 RepID=A0AAV7J9Y3_COTGL|nr:hypothetical protein KQX54_021421 [Cotesia glomerata]